MRFYFTEEDHPTRVRAADIRAALVHARHEVVHGRVGDPPRASTDVWMHGIGVEGSPPIAEPICEQLLASTAPVALFQLCDGETLCFEQIRPDVAALVRLFLRNHWPRDPTRIPEFARGRTGWLPPMVKRMAPHAGQPLQERSHGAVFFGTRTGQGNLGDGRNSREEVVRLMLQSKLPFRGGLLPHEYSLYPVPPELEGERLSERKHGAVLRDAKICLAPWGNHPLTYRLFEGLAARCLVVAQSIRAVTFLDGGLEAGKHYVEVAADLSDLTERVHYYLTHLDEAQRIADAGHAHFVRYFASRGGLISSFIFDATVASWGSLYRASDARGLGAFSRRFAARAFPERF
jgi:hypothetical protein